MKCSEDHYFVLLIMPLVSNELVEVVEPPWLIPALIDTETRSKTVPLVFT